MSDIISFHRTLLNDGPRMQAYRRAIARVVGDGDVVLDLGSGSGVLGFFAPEAGAGRVYAVESSDAAFLARDLARDNGLAGDITFIREDVRRVELPEQVDVVVSELIANGVLGEQQEVLLSCARDRFLKPGGRLIPEQVDLWVAPVESEASYRELAVPALGDYGLDFGRLRELSVNAVGATQAGDDDLLAPPQLAYRLQAGSVLESTHVDVRLGFSTRRAGTLHGFVGWFDATLADDVVLSNAPGGEPLHWARLFLPLAEPVPTVADASVELHLTGKDTVRRPQFWRWDTTVSVPAPAAAAPMPLCFGQSTFNGELLPPDELARRSPDHVARLGVEGRADRTILELMDGDRRLGAIAEVVSDRFPRHFPSWQQALDRVVVLSARYGEASPELRR